MAVVTSLGVDLINVLEVGYARAASLDDWLQRVVATVRPAMERGRGIVAYTLDPAAASVQRFIGLGARPEARRLVEDDLACAERRAAIRALPAGMFISNEVFATHPRWHATSSLVFSIPTGGSQHHVLVAETPQAEALDPVLRPVWNQLALHLAAGARLHGRSVVYDHEDGSRDAVAVEASERDELRELARRLDHDRLHRATAGDEALELWRGLLLDRWSFVDQFDTDERRFLVLRRNQPRGRRHSLTRRQAQVAFYASLALANKQIAFMVGVSETTVASHLGQALVRLGLRSRAELIQIGAMLGPAIDPTC